MENPMESFLKYSDSCWNLDFFKPSSCFLGLLSFSRNQLLLVDQPKLTSNQLSSYTSLLVYEVSDEIYFFYQNRNR